MSRFLFLSFGLHSSEKVFSHNYVVQNGTICSSVFLVSSGSSACASYQNLAKLFSWLNNSQDLLHESCTNWYCSISESSITSPIFLFFEGIFHPINIRVRRRNLIFSGTSIRPQSVHWQLPLVPLTTWLTFMRNKAACWKLYCPAQMTGYENESMVSTEK